MSASRRRLLIGAAAGLAVLPACAALALGGPEGVAPALVGGPAVPALAPEQLPAEPPEDPASATRTLEASPARAVNPVSALVASIPDVALAAYQRAEGVMTVADSDCNLSWSLLAAIGHVESLHGQHGSSSLDASGRARPAIIGVRLDGSGGTARITDTDAGQYDGDRRFDRAVGPMQFIPGTWFVVGVDADGDGGRDPQDIDDAALSAAVYLCSGKEDLSTSDVWSSVLRYNHSTAYARLVLSLADAYADAHPPTSPSDVTVMAIPELKAPGTSVAARRGPEPVSAGDGSGAGSGAPGAGESDPPGEAPGTGTPVDQPPAEEPPVEEPPAEEPPVEEPPAEEPPVEEPPAEEPPTDEPPTDEPPTDEPPVEEPPVTCEAVEPGATGTAGTQPAPPTDSETGDETGGGDVSGVEPVAGECTDPEPEPGTDPGTDPGTEPAQP